MSHTGSLPPQARIRPWVGVGELAHWPLPAARIPPIDPSEDVGLGAVGQPMVGVAPQLSGLAESTLIRAHRHCACCQEEDRMPWESWSPGQWEWFRRRQRVISRREIQRETRAQKAGAV